jgi:hypothetical protein
LAGVGAVLHPGGVVRPGAHLWCHSLFPPAKLDELLAGIGAAIDAAGGSFTLPYATVVVIAQRTDAA